MSAKSFWVAMSENYRLIHLLAANWHIPLNLSRNIEEQSASGKPDYDPVLLILVWIPDTRPSTNSTLFVPTPTYEL